MFSDLTSGANFKCILNRVFANLFFLSTGSDTILGSGAFGEVYLADADGCLVTDSTTNGVRQRLSSKRNSRKGSGLTAEGPVKVAVKTLKGSKRQKKISMSSFQSLLINSKTLKIPFPVNCLGYYEQ